MAYNIKVLRLQSFTNSGFPCNTYTYATLCSRPDLFLTIKSVDPHVWNIKGLRHWMAKN